MSLTWHKQVYHAVHGSQAASLPLTTVHLRGEKKACQVEGEKTAWFFAAQSLDYARLLLNVQLGSALSVHPLSLLKSSSLVESPAHPHREDDADPDIGQGSNSHTVTFAFGSFSLVVVQRPGFCQG